MDLILTHEQADFDAVAALVAGQRLYEGARAVLPQRINQNVAAFLTLYGGQLGLTESTALTRRGKISQVLLVDTQRLASVRGVRHENTGVTVIDHHPLREDLPDHWQLTVEPEVGCTTTLMVERLKAEGLTLSPVEATLLLLGIFEDTGNLTYLTTNPRDAFAAGWVMGFGPLLSAVRQFLHRPLNETQESIYSQVLQSAETLMIEGQAVLVGQVQAEREIELAPVVQKLRDTVETAGVLIAFQVGPDVALICRSINDSVDVGVVARALGGGGHGRAAAAMISRASAAEVLEKVRAVLPEAVQPVVTVAALMSRGPLLLPKTLTVDEAGGLLRRYGHEGDLVVDETGAVVGLLTRTAVDRSLVHGLGRAPVEAVMEAGQVAIAPNATVGELQRVMMESGWGQVPVMDGEGLVGIVTRTDVIRHLGQQQSMAPKTEDLSAALQASLPPAHLKLVRELGELAEELGMALYLVGGFVRDLILHAPSMDFDLVVEGEGIQLAEAVQAKFGGRVTRHARFGTAKWLLPPALAEELDLTALDFVTARQEFYAHPTALPEVEQSSIKHDLHRRDFTLNTLAVALGPSRFGQVLDFYGGLRDLRSGILRVLHSLSFVDDPTRLLRAVRFATRFDFEIENRTAGLMRRALDLLERVSGDRLRHELEACLREPKAVQILNRMVEWGILAEVSPQLVPALPQLEAAIAGAKGDERVLWGLWLGRLSVADFAQVRERLNLPQAITRVVNPVVAVMPAVDALADDAPLSAVDAVVGGVDPTVMAIVLHLAHPPIATRLNAYAQKLSSDPLPLDGDDLAAMGIPRGPELGKLLNGLRAAWLDGEVTSAAAARAWVTERQT